MKYVKRQLCLLRSFSVMIAPAVAGLPDATTTIRAKSGLGIGDADSQSGSASGRRRRGEHRQAAGIVASCSRTQERRNIQAAAKLSREASSSDILTLVSGARRRWYAVMHAEEQKCMCQ
jgi:hypothetical protein